VATVAISHLVYIQYTYVQIVIPAGILYIIYQYNNVYILNVRVYAVCSVYVYAYIPIPIYCTLVEQMKCERARETVIIIFVRTVGGRWRWEEGWSGVCA